MHKDYSASSDCSASTTELDSSASTMFIQWKFYCCIDFGWYFFEVPTQLKLSLQFNCNKSSLKFKPDWVTILDGTQEGTFQWVATNYLLGGLGKEYSETVGVVDLAGGSVQMAYAISEADYENAPRISDGEDSYVKKLLLKGTTYYLYVHSYLHYGLLAARAEILKAGDESFSSCILGGYNGSYKYGGMEFKAAVSPSGSSFSKCKSDAIKALNINETCTHMKCTFGGMWNGGGGDGLKSLFVASFFFDLALEVLTRFEQLVDMRVLRWALEYGRCEEVHDRLPPLMDEY